MPNYANCVHYKIESLDGLHIYVGSTCNLASRRSEHKSNCVNPNSKDHMGALYKRIRELGGWDAFRMAPIQQFACDSKLKACIEEERLRVMLKANLNSKRAATPRTDALQLRKIRQAARVEKYRSENAAKIAEYRDDKILAV